MSITDNNATLLCNNVMHNRISFVELEHQYFVQDELGGIEPRRRARYETGPDARVLREAYARSTRHPHTETFVDKVVGDIKEIFCST